jgi:hypothetical protein
MPYNRNSKALTPEIRSELIELLSEFRRGNDFLAEHDWSWTDLLVEPCGPPQIRERVRKCLKRSARLSDFQIGFVGSLNSYAALSPRQERVLRLAELDAGVRK